jgi:hypothetical protein
MRVRDDKYMFTRAAVVQTALALRCDTINHLCISNDVLLIDMRLNFFEKSDFYREIFTECRILTGYRKSGRIPEPG